MDELVLGVDASTTACKAIAFDAVGTTVAEGRAPVPLSNPEPGAWEQDAEQWWRALGVACRQVVASLGDGGHIAAVCIAHQRETVVVTDAQGRPLAPAVVWMDKRCGPQVARAIEQLGAERLHQLSGKPACTTPSVYKLMELFDRQPALRRAPLRVLDVHGWLAWRLSGRRATALPSADPMGMIDMRARGWSEELVGLAGLEPEALSELVAGGERIGELSTAAAAATGLPASTPLVAGAGDGQAAGLGAGIIAPGRAYLNLGTAVVSGVLSEPYCCDRAFRTLYAPSGDRYLLETDLQGGTFTLDWLVERLLGGGGAKGDRSDQLLALERQAVALAPGSGGLMAVPYWNGVMNPRWDDEASGVVIGWRGEHTAAHLYRAILEGIAFEQRYHLEGVEAAAGSLSELVVMGGGSRSDLWCRILAAVTGKSVVRAGSTEATSLGAAILAAAHVGMFASVERAAGAMTREGSRFEPGAEQPRYDGLYREVYRGLYAAVAERVRALGRLTAIDPGLLDPDGWG